MKLRWGRPKDQFLLSCYRGTILLKNDRTRGEVVYYDTPIVRWYGVATPWGFVGLMLTGAIQERRYLGEAPTYEES